jgi:hypothetical protein
MDPYRLHEHSFALSMHAILRGGRAACGAALGLQPDKLRAGVTGAAPTDSAFVALEPVRHIDLRTTIY